MPETAVDIWFCASARSGLGHLMRCHAIACALAQRRPELRLGMIANAPPVAFDTRQAGPFAEHVIVERDRMAAAVMSRPPRLVVADTLVMPGIETLTMPRALIMREMPDDRLAAFGCADRPWDLVVIPNPVHEWQPRLPAGFTVESVHAGWIYRRTPSVRRRLACDPMLLVSFGGGGNALTRRMLAEQIEPMIHLARQASEQRFDVVQVRGPRASRQDGLSGADRFIEVGGKLNQWLARADVVISTVGYNSILELAQTDVPAMLIPIERSIDDQARRARQWGPRLGHHHREGDLENSASWLAQTITGRRRRPPIDLGPSGQDQAAAALERLLERR
ncbi:MAG: glycosyltransferase [Burkholderiaceae bacterium]